MQDILEFPKVVILTYIWYEKGEAETYFVSSLFSIVYLRRSELLQSLYMPLTSVLTNLVLKNAWIHDIGPGPCMTVLQVLHKMHE